MTSGHAGADPRPDRRPIDITIDGEEVRINFGEPHPSFCTTDDRPEVHDRLGGGKANAMHRMLTELVNTGRKDDLVIIQDPKDPAVPIQYATVEHLAAAIDPTRMPRTPERPARSPAGTVTVHQLDQDGVCWREFDHHPGDEGQLESLYGRIEHAYRMTSTMVTRDGTFAFGVQGTHTTDPQTSAVSPNPATTTATIYRSPQHPGQPWSLGLGFNDHLATLISADDAPIAAADAALAAAGLRRVDDWLPHDPRASWGWRTTTVIKEGKLCALSV